MKIFTDSERYDIVGTASSLTEIGAVMQEWAPDILLCGLDLETIVAKDIEEVCLSSEFTQIILLVDDLIIEPSTVVLGAGARGILPKSAASDQIVKAVEIVYGGNLFIPHSHASRIIHSLCVKTKEPSDDVPCELSVRETQILDQLRNAKTNREIAKSIAISEKSVKRYVSLLMQKMNARNRVELAVRANGLNAVVSRVTNEIRCDARVAQKETLMARYDLSEGEWRLIAPLLPNKPRGVPRVDDRRVINGIFYVLRTGSAWRDVPKRYGPYTTVYNRYNRWAKSGVWARVFETLAARSPRSLHLIDPSIIHGHQHVAERGGAGHQAVRGTPG